jgi:uncharacterized protein
MNASPNGVEAPDSYVGTIVGESTSREFRLAVAHESIREQDIIAVDADLRRPEEPESVERIRVWAKVQRIERLNPLFPLEAGHELAATRTDPLDTVLSLSREMVTAVCQVLGAEPVCSETSGKLRQVRYPPRPATRAYRPDSSDIARIVTGEQGEGSKRSMPIATLANRPEVTVSVDGHAIVTRHLAILAMTGAGKSWAARQIIEQLGERNYPVVIFDPHGDYAGLAATQRNAVLYHAELDVFEEDEDEAIKLVNGLSGDDLSPAQVEAFHTLFRDGRRLLSLVDSHRAQAERLMHQLTGNDDLQKFGLKRNLFGLHYMAECAQTLCSKAKEELLGRDELIELRFSSLQSLEKRQFDTYRVVARQLRRAAFELRGMGERNRKRLGQTIAIPHDRSKVVDYGQISVIGLTGYSEAVRATIYTSIARRIFNDRVEGKIPYHCLLVLEEAHNYVPGPGDHPSSIRHATAITRQIAQEGRKFGIGLMLISQRPSRLDETALSQCNSFMVMRLVNPADQGFVRRVIESLGEDDVRLLPDLDVGEALLSGQLINFPILVRIRPPVSQAEHDEEDAFVQLERTRLGHR